MNSVENLDYMISPKSIAIIGASKNINKISAKPVYSLKNIGYEGEVFLVNPKYSEIVGYPCYENIESLPLNIDLAIISVRASEVLSILQKLAERKVKSIVLFSSGFSEYGEEGAKLENELKQFSNEKGIPICGPNSLGFTNRKDKVIATFSSLNAEYSDEIAFITQSGAIGSLTYTLAQEMGFGYQYFVSSGNETSVDFFDYVNYFAQKEDVKVIGGYLEGARDFSKMNNALQTCKRLNKPLVLMKVGNSKKGADAVSSHTASLAGNSYIYNSYLRFNNVVRVSNEEELIDTLNIFTKTKEPEKIDGGVAIATVSGGAGIIMADQCEECGIRLANLSDTTNKRLIEILPEFASIKNPVDLTAQIAQTPDLIVKSLEIILNDPDVESLILYVQMTDILAEKVIPQYVKLARETNKILILCWAGIKNTTKQLIFEQNDICWIPSPSRAIKALANVTRYYQNQESNWNNEDYYRITEKGALISYSGTVNEWDSKSLLRNYGINIPKGILIKSESDLRDIEGKLKFPVVMKIVSKKINHKSDFGLVKVNVNMEEVGQTFKTLNSNKLEYFPDSDLDGVLVEEMSQDGVEVIIGAIKDPIFGPCVMLGLGGVFVELMNDIVVLPAPLSLLDAHRMIRSIKGFSILNGARSKTKYDIDALADQLVRVAEFIMDNKDILIELDINPLIVHEEGKGVTAVDALVITK